MRRIASKESQRIETDPGIISICLRTGSRSSMEERKKEGRKQQAVGKEERQIGTSEEREDTM